MSSSFTQTQRDLLNNVKQAVALMDKELQRIRQQRMTVCLSGFELDWQLACLGTMQSANGPNKLGSMINAHTDFQAALKDIHGPQTPSFTNGNSEILPKLGANVVAPLRLGKDLHDGREVVAVFSAAVNREGCWEDISALV